MAKRPKKRRPKPRPKTRKYDREMAEDEAARRSGLIPSPLRRVVYLDTLLGSADLTRDPDIARYEVGRRHDDFCHTGISSSRKPRSARRRSLDEQTDRFLAARLKSMR